MLFNRKAVTFSIAFFTCIAFHAIAKENSTSPAQSNTPSDKNPPYNFHGEVDKTDIFAIPLDQDELEDEEELDKLEKGWPEKGKS